MPPRARAPLLITTLALLWGTNFALIKIALQTFTPTQLTFTRMLLGALFLYAVVAAQSQPLPRGRHIWLHLTIAALLANAAPYLLFAIAETHVDSNIAGIANATTPLWTLVLVAALNQGDTITRRRIAGFIIGLAGSIILFAPWNTNSADPLGVLLCLAAALSYAISYVYMARYVAPSNFSPAALSAAQLIAATGWTLLPLAFDPGPTPALELRPLLALIALGILGTGAAYTLNYTLIRTDGPAGASTVTYLVPIVSILTGAALLAEPINNNLTAAALVILGVILSRQRIPQRFREPYDRDLK